MSDEALGMAKTEGLVGAIGAASAMTEAANVAPVSYEKIGSGLVTVMVRGDVGVVGASVDVGAAAVINVGQVISQYVAPGPRTNVEEILPKSL